MLSVVSEHLFTEHDRNNDYACCSFLQITVLVTHCRLMASVQWDVLAHMPLERRKIKSVTDPANVGAGHLYKFSMAVFFSHFVTLLQ